MALLRAKILPRLLLIAVLSSFLIGAKGSDFIVMTVVNKAGMEVAVSILANDLSRNYYVVIPEGSRQHPTIKQFTVIKDEYRMRVFYMEDKDPETDAACVRVRNATLLAFRNMRVTVTACDRREICCPGEPTMYKFGRWRCLQ